MKKVLSFFTTLLAIVLFAGCGSNEAEEKEEYKGMKLNKRLIESLMNYYPESWRNYSYATLCGEYIVLQGISEDGEHKDGYVLMDEDGAIGINRIYINPDKIGEFSNGLAAVDYIDYKNRTEEWKLINDGGQVIEIGGDTTFQYIGPWVEGNAMIIKDNKVGLINNEGKIVIPIGQYPTLLTIDNGLIIASGGIDRVQFGFLDKNAKEIVPAIYDAVSYQDKVLRVKKDSKWGVMDKEGKVVLPVEYDEIGEFKKEGGKYMAKVSKAGKYGMINKKGKIVIPCEYEDIIDSRWNGEIYFEGFKVKKNGKYGAVDFSGNEVWPMEFDKMHIVGAGLADVTKNGKKGVINHQGKWIDVRAHDIIDNAMVIGHLVLDKNNERKIGAYDENGDIAIPFEYSDVNMENGYLSLRKSDGSYNAYNYKGKKIADGDFCKIETCGDYVKIMKDYETPSIGIYDKEGSEIIPLEYNEISKLSVNEGDSEEYFFEASKDKKNILYSKSFKKIHSLETENGSSMGYYNTYRFLNGYYTIIDKNKDQQITIFISNDQEFLFEVDGYFSWIKLHKNYTLERQNEFIQTMLNLMNKD